MMQEQSFVAAQSRQIDVKEKEVKVGGENETLTGGAGTTCPELPEAWGENLLVSGSKEGDREIIHKGKGVSFMELLDSLKNPMKIYRTRSPAEKKWVVRI